VTEGAADCNRRKRRRRCADLGKGLPRLPSVRKLVRRSIRRRLKAKSDQPYDRIGPTRQSAPSHQRVIDTRRPTCVSSTSVQHVGQSVPARRFAITSDGCDGAQVAAAPSGRTRTRRYPSCRLRRSRIRHRRSRTCCRSAERAGASAALASRGDTVDRRGSSPQTRRSSRERAHLILRTGRSCEPAS
jgi:hypothetical protein